jgi:hypothetical protein
MARLNQAELELLDFLCAAAYFRCRVKRLRGSCKSPIRRLRYAGLVALQGFAPSPWAMKDWIDRQPPERLIQTIFETPAQSRTPELAEPAEPGPEADGGGASVRDECQPAIVDEAPPPDHHDISETAAAVAVAQPADEPPPAPESEAVATTPVVARPPLTDADLAFEFEYQGAPESAREALSVPLLGGTEAEQSARRIEDRAPHDEPAAVRNCPPPSPAHHQAPLAERRPSGAELADQLERWARASDAPIIRVSLFLFNSQSGIRSLRDSKHPKDSTIAKVRAFFESPPAIEELPERPPQNRPPYVPKQPSNDGARAAAAVRQAQTSRARNWLDSGKTIADAPPSMKIEIRAELTRRAEQARRADPVEQAKLIIRRKTRLPVFGAEVTDGPKGKFFIGRRLVTEKELLAEARRLDAA